MSLRGRACALVGLLLPGCGPTVELEGSGSSSSGTLEASSSGAEPGSTGSTGTTGTTGVDEGSTGSSSASTGDEPPSGYEDDGLGTGCAFTCPNPPPPPPPPGDPWCNLSCPEGEKCMPWANDGGMEWNALRCSPLAPDPGAPGDVCEVEGWQWSGIDDCDATALCWQVDPKTNIGTCHAFCGAVSESEVCADGYDCAVFPTDVPLCVVSCDPLVPLCDEGQLCLPSGSGFTCLVHDGTGAALGEPCDAPDACDAEGLCAFDPAFSCGNAPGQGCCAAPCDIDAPGPCGGPGSSCETWFPLRPPPELAHLGVCAQ